MSRPSAPIVCPRDLDAFHERTRQAECDAQEHQRDARHTATPRSGSAQGCPARTTVPIITSLICASEFFRTRSA